MPLSYRVESPSRCNTHLISPQSPIDYLLLVEQPKWRLQLMREYNQVMNIYISTEQHELAEDRTRADMKNYPDANIDFGARLMQWTIYYKKQSILCT